MGNPRGSARDPVHFKSVTARYTRAGNAEVDWYMYLVHVSVWVFPFSVVYFHVAMSLA